jgi:hypothetical protein
MRASLDTARAETIVHVAKYRPLAFARERRLPQFAGESTRLRIRRGDVSTGV